MSRQAWLFLFAAISPLLALIKSAPDLYRWYCEFKETKTTPSSWTKRTQIVVMLALVVSFILSSVGFYLSYDKALNPPVYAEFRSVYRAHENQLGSATGRVVADGAYQAWHERATVVWISKLPGFVILPVHSQNWIPDDDMAAWDPRLASDGYVTGILNRSIPDGLFPPTRGMARLFLQDPDYWIESRMERSGLYIRDRNDPLPAISARLDHRRFSAADGHAVW
jgi:hypothetical protein